MLQFQLPWPPSANHYKTHTRSGHTYLTAQARKYHQAVNAQLLSVLPYPHTPYSHPLQVAYHFHAPAERKYDIANFEKVVSDSLTRANLWEDDFLISHLTLIRCPKDPNKKGFIHVSIQPYLG